MHIFFISFRKIPEISGEGRSHPVDNNWEPGPGNRSPRFPLCDSPISIAEVKYVCIFIKGRPVGHRPARQLQVTQEISGFNRTQIE